jgi:hypothetical protein
MKYLIFALVLNLIVSIGTILIVIKFNNKKIDNVVRVIHESRMNLMFCFILYSLAIALIVFKINNPILAGSDRESYMFISLLSIFSATVSSYIVIYTLNRKYLLTNKNVIHVDLLGHETSVAYKYINTVKLSRFKKTIYLYFGNDRFSIHCSNEKIFKKFILEVSKNLQNGVVIEDIGMFSGFNVKKGEE